MRLQLLYAILMEAKLLPHLLLEFCSALSLLLLLPACGGGLIVFVLLSDRVVSSVELQVQLFLLRSELRLKLRP